MNDKQHLEVSINQPVGLKIIIILSKWIYELLCDLMCLHVNKQIKERMCVGGVNTQWRNINEYCEALGWVLTFSQPA